MHIHIRTLAIGAAGAVALTTTSTGSDGVRRLDVHPAISAARSVRPAGVRGARAIPSDTFGQDAGATYGLFTCQVGLSSATCYDPYQVRRAYKVDALISSGLTGWGRTIVIVDAYQSPKIKQQLAIFDSFYGLPALNGADASGNPNLGTFTQIAPDGLTPFVPGDPNMTGWAEEISLDVEWAHAIAPNANITLVLARSNEDSDILSATKYAVDHNLGDVISQSFGANESCSDPGLLAAQHDVFAAATAKHITLFASTGDEGAAQMTCDGTSWTRAASSPATDPLVTAVGGTELHAAKYCLTSLGCNPAANPAFGTYLGETAWNEDFGTTAATGGGYSVLYDEPSYQQGTIHGGNQRAIPDISYSAAVLHGVLTWLDIPGLGSGWFLFGGTSAGSPQWAAIIAIADQKAGYDLGFINRALYTIGQAQHQYAASLHDVTTGDNSAVELDAENNPVIVPGFSAGTGWDATTGLGAPIADSLVSYLIQFVSGGDGQAAIVGSAPHGGGQGAGHGHAQPH